MDRLSQSDDFPSPAEPLGVEPSLGVDRPMAEPPPIADEREYIEEPISSSEEIGERAFEEMAGRAAQFLRTNPVPAVLGGLALGFVVGRLLRRH